MSLERERKIQPKASQDYQDEDWSRQNPGARKPHKVRRVRYRDNKPTYSLSSMPTLKPTPHLNELAITMNKEQQLVLTSFMHNFGPPSCF